MMKRKPGEGRLALAGLMVAAVVAFLGAAPPLNPLVIRSDAQRTSVPDDCNVSLAPAPTPRVEVKQIPLPPPETPPMPPPSASLRETLEGVQQAIARNDRAGFDTDLARARRLVADYPSGAERRAAEELLAMYGDVERLWDAQYRSPFFARESAEFALANRYRGWEEAVRRSILTDAEGTRFYPAAESRDVVARAAADRLRQLGLTATTPAPRTRETRASSQDTNARPRTTTTPRETARSTPRSTSGTARSTTARKPPAPSRATPRRTRARSDGAPASARSTSTRSGAASTATPRSTSAATAVAPAPVAVPPAASPVAVVDGAPVTAPGSVAALPTEEAGGTTTTDPFSDPAFTTDPLTTAVTETSATDTPVTATDATATAGETSTRGRSIVLPLVLILIGLGVLVVLFRMSS